MAWKESHKQESRQRILLAAAALFTRKGFNNVGIDEVMESAGMTRGAFYAHFNSKIELYEQAIMTAGITAAQRFNNNAVDHMGLIENYLSEEQLNSTDICCPMACLISDVAHDDDRVKDIYTRLYKGFTKHLAKFDNSDCDDADNNEDKILMQSVVMIGGLALARSLTDKALAKKILRLSSKAAQQLHTEKV
ncbi:TetR/AcrR family transcriptional regulator [Cellvibrio sp. UBA7661]|uniref:TetR/AcrR family transcriptional regulator n=1 Tax=Cellvibrio sp. UBA7661 TaxID=1946311 RepID=UPI002F35B339